LKHWRVKDMNEEEKLSIKGYILLALTIIFAIVSVSIIQTLFSAKYPTHSDVFFMGVECGVLVVVLLICLFLICLFLYRLIRMYRPTTFYPRTSIGVT
jgi:uncharacterized BrkB/YihY/UPF0761 family membrane protein